MATHTRAIQFHGSKRDCANILSAIYRSFAKLGITEYRTSQTYKGWLRNDYTVSFTGNTEQTQAIATWWNKTVMPIIRS